jgi:hypothetical protein
MMAAVTMHNHIIILWLSILNLPSLFIVTAAIIDGRFNEDSQGIIICLFIVTAAIINGRFHVDSQGIII